VKPKDEDDAVLFEQQWKALGAERLES